MEASADLRCSFCGKRREEVDGLIAKSTIDTQLEPNRYAASVKVAICDECVHLCVEILEEGKTAETSP